MAEGKPVSLEDLTNVFAELRDEIGKEGKLSREEFAKRLEAEAGKLREEVKGDIEGLERKLSQKVDRQLERIEASFSRQVGRLQGDIGALQSQIAVGGDRGLVFAGGRLLGTSIKGYTLEFPPKQLFRRPR